MPTFIPRHLRYVHARYLFVTDTLLTSTITKPSSLERQDLLIPTILNTCVVGIDLGLKSHPNDWYIDLYLIYFQKIFDYFQIHGIYILFQLFWDMNKLFAQLVYEL